MSDSWVLEDKLRLPLAGGVTPRARVTRLLDKAVRCRVALVTGPAGAGKTVACAGWAVAAAAKRRRVAWLRVDAADREPARLWAGISAALAGQPHPQVPRTRPGRQDDLTGLPGLADPVVLVLDDIHELAGSPAVAALDRLVQHAPPPLRLVLAGRYSPGLQLARLRVAGELATVGEEELACAPDEAAECFSELGLTAEPWQRGALLRYTGGWMTGLRLTALAGNMSPAASAVAAGYLRDEILSGQTASAARFLLRLSVAGELTAELAGRLTGERTATELLERLHHENSFVHQVDARHYRLHPFVKDMLAAELRRREPDEVPGLLRTAGDWYAARGEVDVAAGILADAGEWTRTASLLAEGGVTGLLPGRARQLAAALGQLPVGARRADPAIIAAQAAAFLCDGASEAACACLDQAEQPAADKPALKLWVTALRVMGDNGGPAAHALGMARAHSAAVDEAAERRALGVLWTALGTAALRHQDIPAASEALRQAGRQLAIAGPAAMRDRAGCWHALAEALGGDLAAADAILTELPERAETACLRALAAAQRALDRDDLAAAGVLLASARAAPFHALPGEPHPDLIAGLIAARVRLADRDIAGARAELYRLAGEHADSAAVGSLAADIASQAGDSPPSAEPGGPLAHGRALLASGDAAGAATLADQCLSAQPGTMTVRDQVTALLLAAIAGRRLGDQAAAGRLLEQALALAGPHGLTRPFLDGGTTVRSAITMLIRPESGVAAFAARVLQRFAYQVPGAGEGAGGAVRLTAGELAVLRFLPSHPTNREIAESMSLSVNTVKTQLHSAYRKLGVTSRRAAIARCERLRLL